MICAFTIVSILFVLKSSIMSVKKQPAKRVDRAKTLDSYMDVGSQELKRNRAKNYSQFECETLLKTCDAFHEILSKNSNRYADIKQKADAWQKIKKGYDLRVQAEGFEVERSVEQLQAKYKDLKKVARGMASGLKREMAQTGNRPLRSSASRELRNTDTLLALRKQMGPTATGFESKHCN